MAWLQSAAPWRAFDTSREYVVVVAAALRRPLKLLLDAHVCLTANVRCNGHCSDASGNPLAALSFDITYIDDANGTFATRGWLESGSLFQRNIRAAAALWGSQFDSDATIEMHVDPTSFAARAGGTFSLGRQLYVNAAGNNVWEAGPLTRILTGSNSGANASGFDIRLGFDAEFVDSKYWLDPQPGLRSAPVPAGKGDFLSVVMHEIGHGFGMAGFRDFHTGEIAGSAATQFDDASYFGGNGEPFSPNGAPNPLYFGGGHVAAVYGSELPLTHKPAGDFLSSQNFYHLSACSPGAADELQSTLMNGCALPSGDRLYITETDLAVFADLGYPLAQLPGDYNDDDAVDAADYVVWRNSLGQMGTNLPADGNLDNRIDTGDYAFWRAHVGTAAESSFALVNIPEPISILLLCGLMAIPTRASRPAPARALRPNCSPAGRASARSWSS